MHMVLAHQKCAKAFGGESSLPDSMLDADKAEVMEIAYNLLILHLFDNVLRQVDDENIAAKIWLKLKSIYVTKSLTNKTYFKEQLFGFKMDPNKSLDDNLDEFKKIIVSLANIEEKISNEN